MEFRKFKTEFNGMLFEIEEDLPEVGAYLYVYENGLCTRDDLQNTINDCMEIALEMYGIPLEVWEEVDSIRAGR
jgi:hypothetical protein